MAVVPSLGKSPIRRGGSNHPPCGRIGTDLRKESGAVPLNVYNTARGPHLQKTYFLE